MGIARRWELILLIASGLLVAYTQRVNISVAIGKMSTEFGWSVSDKGNILSSFYWGYAVGQLPASLLGQLYGSKWIFGLSIFIPSVLTLFVPLASQHSYGMAVFIRVLIGLCASGTFPAIFAFFRNWIPNAERTLMIPIVYAGIYVGEIISFPICGLLVESDIAVFGGWQSTFYLFGLVGILWFPMWAFRAFEHPEQHPNITKDEIKLINKGKRLVTIAELDEMLDRTERPRAATILYQAIVLPEPVLSEKGDQTVTNQVESSMSADNLLETNLLPPSEKDSIRTTQDDGAGDIEQPRKYSVLNMENIEQHNREEQAVGSSVPLPEKEEDMKSIVSFLSDDAHAMEIAVRTPWCAFFHSMAFAALIVNGWASDFLSTMLLSEMPSFLTHMLNFSESQAGILSMPPFAALFVSVIAFGLLFEHLELEYKWSVEMVRLWAQMLSLVGASGCLLVVVYCDNIACSYAFLIIAQIFYGASTCGVYCGYTDISPNFSFSMNTIGNTTGSIAGLLGPLIVAAFTAAYPGMEGWRASFLLTTAMSVVAVIFWYFFSYSQVIDALNTPTKKRKVIRNRSRDDLNAAPPADQVGTPSDDVRHTNAV